MKNIAACKTTCYTSFTKHLPEGLRNWTQFIVLSPKNGLVRDKIFGSWRYNEDRDEEYLWATHSGATWRLFSWCFFANRYGKTAVKVLKSVQRFSVTHGTFAHATNNSVLLCRELYDVSFVLDLTALIRKTWNVCVTHGTQRFWFSSPPYIQLTVSVNCEAQKF